MKNLLKRIDLKVAIKMGLVALLADLFSLGFNDWFKRPDKLASGVWTILAALVVLQANLGGTYKAALNRSLGIFIGSILGGLFTSWLGSNPLSLALATAFTVVFCYLLNLKDGTRIATMSTAIIVLLWGVSPEINPWIFSGFRFIDSFAGIIIALLVAHLLWPSAAIHKLRKNTSQILLLLGKFYERIFFFQPPTLSYTPSSQEIFSLRSELDNLFRESDGIVDESSFEAKMRGERDEVVLLHNLKEIFEELLSLRELDIKYFSEFFDDSLKEKVSLFSQKFIETCQTISKIVEREREQEWHPSLLLEVTENLNKDLLRFRETRATRKLNLYQLENFFAFFYTLKTLAKDLSKCEEDIKKSLTRDEL